MPAKANERITVQLDEVLQEFANLRKRSQYDDISDLPHGEIERFVTRARAAIHRVAGKPSVYVEQCEEIVRTGTVYLGHIAKLLVGVLEALRTDVASGYLQSQRELIHGELFADFLEMAQHLLDEGYKDAAAVIAGSSLEAHLKQLCIRAGIDLEVISSKGPRPKAADQLNADIAKVPVYGKLDQKNVTAWLDLRNKAAHGNYSEYQKEQVSLMVSGIRDFMTRNPA